MADKLTVKNATTAGDLLAAIQKSSGEHSGSWGGKMVNADRIPTGVMALDMALGGGFPRGRASVIYGPESSSKTNLALLAIANNQRLNPEEVNVFIDAENSFDPHWASKLGVDCEKLIVMSPLYAEQIIDWIESFLYTRDVGIIVLDSIANMTTMATIEKDGAQGSFGGNSIAVSAMSRKAVVALTEQQHEDLFPALILINQTRMKIGVMFGDPEDMPGGRFLKHLSSMTLRVHGKNIIDKVISEEMPMAKEVKFAIKKWKVPIIAAGGKFTQAMLPWKGLSPGQSDDLELIESILTDYGLYEKGPKGKGWMIMQELYPTQGAFASRFLEEKVWASELRSAVIKKVFADSPLMLEGVDGEEKGAA